MTETATNKPSTTVIKKDKQTAPDKPAGKETTGSEACKDHITFMEKQKGFSFDRLFGPYLKGAKHIVVTDPYIRAFHQILNFMALMNTVVRLKAEEDEIVVSLVTAEDDEKGDQQRIFFEQIQNLLFAVGIKFAWSFDNSGVLHARLKRILAGKFCWIVGSMSFNTEN